MAELPELGDRARGWLRYLWRKSTTPDDWTEDGQPHAWWDRTTGPPMTNFPRFDLQESSYALAMMADTTPAWREVYARILDELLRRYTTFWAAVDWLTQFGHDPKRKEYPPQWKGVLIPEHVWGEYDSPGWTANGIEPWGLQRDPIGADGNLFFRGFFNLVLSIYAYVADDGKWHEPFSVAGVERSRHEWTHVCIAEFLSHQWANRPEGPHCESTKIWPYCLSAAGLGLQLFDRLYRTNHHWVYDRWVEVAREKFMRATSDGRFQSLALYYDPILDHAQHLGAGGGLAPAFYVLPQNRALAETLYEAGIGALGWRDPSHQIAQPDGRMGATVLMLARELGDDVIEKRVREVADSAYEPKHFGADGSEFGYWFGLGEEYPRGHGARSRSAPTSEPTAPGRACSTRPTSRSSANRRFSASTSPSSASPARGTISKRACCASPPTPASRRCAARPLGSASRSCRRRPRFWCDAMVRRIRDGARWGRARSRSRARSVRTRSRSHGGIVPPRSIADAPSAASARSGRCDRQRARPHR